MLVASLSPLARAVAATARWRAVVEEGGADAVRGPEGNRARKDSYLIGGTRANRQTDARTEQRERKFFELFSISQLV